MELERFSYLYSRRLYYERVKRVSIYTLLLLAPLSCESSPYLRPRGDLVRLMI